MDYGLIAYVCIWSIVYLLKFVALGTWTRLFVGVIVGPFSIFSHCRHGFNFHLFNATICLFEFSKFTMESSKLTCFIWFKLTCFILFKFTAFCSLILLWLFNFCLHSQFDHFFGTIWHLWGSYMIYGHLSEELYCVKAGTAVPSPPLYLS